MVEIRIDGVSKSFTDHNARIDAVKPTTLHIHGGEKVAIVGPSGSGKTTLLNLIGLILEPDSGSVSLDGRKVSGLSDASLCALRNKYFGYVVQDFALIENRTALYNILIPLLYCKDKKIVKEAKGRIKNIAQHFGIEDRLRAKAKTLSGGERQRVSITRAIVCNQPIILADEPTGSLDAANRQKVIEILDYLVVEEGKILIMVTHDTNIVQDFDRIFHINDGILTEAKSI